MLGTIIDLFTGGVGKYIVIALAFFAAVAWVRADAAAPYKAQIVAMKQSLVQRAAIEKADATRAETDRSEIERLKAIVETIANESRTAGACQLSPADVAKLHRLATGKH